MRPRSCVFFFGKPHGAYFLLLEVFLDELLLDITYFFSFICEFPIITFHNNACCALILEIVVTLFSLELLSALLLLTFYHVFLENLVRVFSTDNLKKLWRSFTILKKVFLNIEW